MKSIPIRIQPQINLEHIAISGQCFRWQKSGDKYSFIYQDNYVECFNDNESTHIQGIEDAKIKEYFDLNTDYDFIKSNTDANDKYLQSAIGMFGDVRILRQNLWETIVSFIISQRKSIPAISRCIQSLCERFGNPILNNGFILGHSFPTAESIQYTTIDELKECGVGYRARYIKDAASWYLSTSRSKISKDSVKEIYGVGEKVANCIGLFGLHDFSCCPIDIWMKRIIDNRYYGEFPSWMDSEYAGIYQQYVFMYERWIQNRIQNI